MTEIEIDFGYIKDFIHFFLIFFVRSNHLSQLGSIGAKIKWMMLLKISKNIRGKMNKYYAKYWISYVEKLK
jgi:hypothetical protein